MWWSAGLAWLLLGTRPTLRKTGGTGASEWWWGAPAALPSSLPACVTARQCSVSAAGTVLGLNSQ